MTAIEIAAVILGLIAMCATIATVIWVADKLDSVYDQKGKGKK